MTGGYHIINATGTVITITAGSSDYIIYDGDLRDIVDSIKNNKIIVLEGQKTTRGGGAGNVDTGAWVLNFVHNFIESDDLTVDAYEAVVETGGVRIVITLDWDAAEFGYAVETL